ncbi:hypothetical protein C0J52_19798 [Blattella germanica]|nr:hypothetical protein C0J52_19798 [Blattella germanica]
MNCSEKKRCPNLSMDERHTLVDLVLKRIDILENKKLDNAMQAKKTEHWKIVADEFSAICTDHVRSPENLKTAWENLKKATRRAVFQNPMAGVQTPIKWKLDPLFLRVLAAIRPDALPKFLTKQRNSPISTRGTIDKDVEDYLPSEPVCSVSEQDDAPISTQKVSDISISANDHPPVSSDVPQLEKEVLEDAEIVYEEHCLVDTKIDDVIPEDTVNANYLRGIKCDAGSKNKIHNLCRKRKYSQRHDDELSLLLKAKLEESELQKKHAEEKHKMLKQLHEIKLLREMESLKQDKLKTKLLLRELKMDESDLKD